MPSLPRVAVGTMNFGARTPKDEARRIVDRAFEQEGTPLFDTANLYGEGESERILGELLAGRRERAKIATKVGLLRRGGKAEGLSAARVVEALDESLARLKTDHVDLYYLHAPDHSTPLEETLEGVERVVTSGKAKAWGVSNFASWQILDLQNLCGARGLPRPLASQVLYNLLVRQLDIEYFAFCRAHPIHTTVYNPLAGGVLAHAGREVAAADRKDGRLNTNPLYRKRYGSDAMRALSERYVSVAREAGMDLITFSYAWLAGRPGVDSVLVGPASLAHYEAALVGLSTRLDRTWYQRADEIHREFVGTDTNYVR